jgi:hypothetical protein
MPHGKCDVCGNQYDKAFHISAAGVTYTFDSFECAIEKLAPRCGHCNLRVIGHGVEKDSRIYCCGHCAEAEGVTEIVDRV